MRQQQSSDQLVDAKAILEAIAELKRRGNNSVMQELESLERELAGHVMEELSLIYQGLLKTGAGTKLVRQLNHQIESLALVTILSLRKAYCRLWQENAEGTPLARLDPPEELIATFNFSQAKTNPERNFMSTCTDTVRERVTLYFREGSSDKVYHAAIEPNGAGFVVNFAYGRRGSTLQTGTKTSSPVNYSAAKKIYDKLVIEKTAKGYTPGEDGTPYQQTDKAERSTGILPQLLNPIDESDVDRFIKDDAWWAQEKFDGKRILIRKNDQNVTGINRKGLVIDLPVPIVQAVQKLDARRCLLDGEAVGDTFIVFDLPQEATLDLTSQPYHVRYVHLVDLVDSVPSDSIRYAETATTKPEKLAMLKRLREERKEGIVFKCHTAPYVPGRPASGGNQLKLKFTATASCIVAGANGSRRSVKLELLDGPRRTSIGNVTIPPNHLVPAVNQIVEVRYLYAYPGGSLYQPVYLGKRDDIDAGACTMRQLKFKAKMTVKPESIWTQLL